MEAEEKKEVIDWKSYPLSLEPKHMREILDVGERQIYEFLNQKEPPFHMVRVGRLIKVSKNVFRSWFEGPDYYKHDRNDGEAEGA